MLPMSTNKCLALLLLPIACTSPVDDAPESLPDPLAAGWQGATVCERLHENELQRILLCRFPPGVGHERHYHAPHFGYSIVGGKMQINSDGETRVVDVPDNYSWTNDERIVHDVLNVGETTAVYLIVERRPPG